MHYRVRYSLEFDLKIRSGQGCKGCPQTHLEYFWYHSEIKGRLSYHLCVECFSQLSFESEGYLKSAAFADFVYTSKSNESCEKHSTQR